MKTREIVSTGKLKFFKTGAKLALEQFRNYRYNNDGDKVVKKKDHVVDCVMYFCREIPQALQEPTSLPDEKSRIMKDHLDKVYNNPVKRSQMTRLVKIPLVRPLKFRGVR
jgi:hypothetical protein